jgi:AcrR family transcriptional regulator
MKISELARVSGVGRSTIHFYRNVGLLPPEVRRGPKLHLYGHEHRRRLREIAELRARGASMDELRRRFATRDAKQPARKPSGRRTQPASPGADSELRARILDAAARQFVERGFDAVRVEDVARAAGIGKVKLYELFASKATLFVDCLDRLRYAVFGTEQRATLEGALSYEDEGRLRAAAVLHRFPPYRMMANLLSQAACGSDEELARRARAALHRMVIGAEPMFQRAIETGRCRPMNTELLAYMTWGALLAVGDRLALDRRFTLEQALDAYLDFVERGIGPEREAPDR